MLVCHPSKHSRRSAAHTSSKVPKPPGRQMNAHDRFAISNFRSCIEFTIIYHDMDPVGQRHACKRKNKESTNRLFLHTGTLSARENRRDIKR